MKSIATNTDYVENKTLLQEIEGKYRIKIREEIKEFIKLNSGGYPLKDVIEVDGEKYEVRVFLSVNQKNKDYYMQKALNYFLEKTNGKIIPVGIDSGDNYYCIHNETGNVYFWNAGENLYYKISDSVEDFVELF